MIVIRNELCISENGDERMKIRFTTLAATGIIKCLAAAQMAQASPVELYVDSAPNVFGSPDYAPWWDATKQSVVNGTFTNLGNGTYPGTNNIDPDDMIVHSYGDLGKRVTWIYWLEGQTVENLTGNFEIKFRFDWDGDMLTYDWSTGATVLDGAEVGWVEPGSWANYEGGVIGTFGHAWWAADPNDPNQTWDEYDEVRASILENQTMLEGLVRYRENEFSEWQYENLMLNVIPAPAAAPVLAACLALVGVGRRRRQ